MVRHLHLPREEELMRLKAAIKNEKQRAIPVRRHSSGVDALAIREVYPAEEFAGFENFGEFPEWHPGQVEASEEPEREIAIGTE